MESELHLFIKEALAKGLAKDKIKEVLLQANWQEQEISEALNHYADVSFPVAVPKRKPYLSAREAFMYLLTFLTLYLSAYNIGALIFQFINRAFPDATRASYAFGADFEAGVIRFAIASLLIAFPIYLGLTMYLQKRASKNPEARVSRVRKWLTYLTLFFTAGVMIGDLIALINNLLAGDITMRFILKFITVFAISGLIFWYYLTDLRAEEKSNEK